MGGIGIDYPTAITLFRLRNKLHIQHRIPLPSLSSYPDGMTSVEALAWEDGGFGGADKAASNEVRREL